MKLAHPFSAMLVAALVSTAPAARAEPLTRERAIAEAVQQSPEVAAARARRNAAEAQSVQADALRWPEITIEAGVGPSQQATLVPGTQADSTKSRYGVSDLSVVLGGSVSVVQPLYTFGKIDSMRAAAAHGVRARGALVTATQADVALSVARLYESLLLARDGIRLGEEVSNAIERQIAATEQRIAAHVPELAEKDILRLQTALAAARISLNQARAGAVEARAGLAAYLGRAAGAAIEPKEDALVAIAPAERVLSTLVAEGLGRRPELTALQQAARAHDAVAVAERAKYLPDIVVLAWATGAYTPGRDLVTSRYVIDPLNSFVPGVLLGARWQIQGNMASGRADERAAQAEEHRRLASWVEVGVPAQVTRAHAELERARRDMADTAVGVQRAKKWMVQANADYVAGLADSAQLVDATRAYAELRVAALDAAFRNNVALADLAFATGSIVSDSLGIYPGKVAP